MNSTNQTTINTILIVALLILNLVGLAMNMNGADADVEAAVKSAMHEIQAEQVGGEENYELVQKLQNSQAFKDAQKQQYQAYLDQLEGGTIEQPNTNDTTNNSASNTLSDEQLAAVTDNIVIQGDEDAPILLVEYSDIECPYCKRHHQNGTVEEVLEKHADDVKATFKHFPLSFHDNAQHNAEAIECAKDQADAETIYEFIGALFDADDISEEGTIAVATDLGLDTDALQACMDSGDKSNLVAANMQEGQSVFGVNGTPGNVLINTETGEYIVVSGAQPYSAFKSAIEDLLD